MGVLKNFQGFQTDFSFLIVEPAFSPPAKSLESESMVARLHALLFHFIRLAGKTRSVVKTWRQANFFRFYPGDDPPVLMMPVLICHQRIEH